MYSRLAVGLWFLGLFFVLLTLSSVGAIHGDKLIAIQDQRRAEFKASLISLSLEDLQARLREQRLMVTILETREANKSPVLKAWESVKLFLWNAPHIRWFGSFLGFRNTKSMFICSSVVALIFFVVGIHLNHMYHIRCLLESGRIITSTK